MREKKGRMNKLEELFKRKNNNLLSIYFTAGHPEADSTVKIVKALEKAGVDFVEVGMPFSDPLADGPTIQRSSEIALRNGMNLDRYFEALESVKDEVALPLVAMGYVNQMMRYGEERFLKRCSEAGISGLILPDLPLKVYEKDYRSLFERYGLVNIFLITPQTTPERIRQIDAASRAFIYMVSSSSTTGVKNEIEKEQLDYFKRVQSMNLNNPLIIGFGISNRVTYENACRFASGAIIGSAFVKALEKSASESAILEFVRSIRA
jgi:tryptophan synthase alpha chain